MVRFRLDAEGAASCGHDPALGHRAPHGWLPLRVWAQSAVRMPSL